MYLYVGIKDMGLCIQVIETHVHIECRDCSYCPNQGQGICSIIQTSFNSISFLRTLPPLNFMVVGSLKMKFRFGYDLDIIQLNFVFEDPTTSRDALSFFFSWGSKTQRNHWTKRMPSTRFSTQDPRTCPGPEDRSITQFMVDPIRSPKQWVKQITMLVGWQVASG